MRRILVNTLAALRGGGVALPPQLIYEVLCQCPSQPAEVGVEKLASEVQGHVHAHEAFDDTTMVVLKRASAPPSTPARRRTKRRANAKK